MSISDKTTIKANFQTGDKPTQTQFEDLIDTCGGTIQGIDNTYDIQPANEGSTTGNARGENSVDLCTLRSEVDYVCAGACSGAIGGEDVGGTGTHTAYLGGLKNYGCTGNYSVVSGSYNYGNAGNCCSISGSYNIANGGNNNIIGGYSNQPNIGSNCIISGEGHAYNSGSHCLISGKTNLTNSGNYCSISGSNNYDNTGYCCSISGKYNNSNSGYYCSISGEGNSINGGSHCSISGKYNNSNSGAYSLISGHSATSNALSYARVHGGKSNARIIDLVAQIDTVNTDPIELLLGGSGGARIVIPDQSAWNVDVRFVAKTATGSNAASQNFTGLIVRDGSTTTYAAGTSDAAITEIGTSNAAFAVAADDTNEALQLTVTASSGTLRASARVQLAQVDY